MSSPETQRKPAVDILVVAIGAYGRLYVQALKKWREAGRVRIRGVVDPFAESSAAWPGLKAAGVPLFDTIEAFLASGRRADLAIISSPIAFHADHACAALEGGMHVLCEKPLAALIQDAYRMIDARDRAGRFVEIGYQWSFSRTIQKLKADILAGRLGAPREMRTWIATQRDASYFARNNWGGCIRDDEGRYVFDSPANNATAHQLHNMLYLLGADVDRAAVPTAVTGECYRGHPIENFDTACCRIATRDNVDVLYYTTHCVTGGHGPYFHFEFDDALATLDPGGALVARFHDGHEENYGTISSGESGKLEHCLTRCEAPGGGSTLCGVEAALPQTICINALQQMAVYDLTAPHIRQRQISERGVLTYIPDIEKIMHRACEARRLFSETDTPWARPSQRVDIDSLPAIPGGAPARADGQAAPHLPLCAR